MNVARSGDVLVVGSGPAGLAAAIELRRRGVRDVEVLERETQAGGVPRHCQHLGFGMRDLHRVMSGPAYAEHYARAAANAGVRLRLATTATEWTGPRTLSLTSRAGVEEVTAGAVILATGARERPRSARLVAGTRPSGVYTTGQLQQLVYLQGRRLEGRCVIVGAEHVSYSAALTARHAGATVVAMLSELDAHQTYAAFARAASWRFRFPLLTETTVERIVGQGALRGVEVRDRAGRSRTIDADFVVFTGDWIPDHEIARRGGLTLHPATKGPIVDTSLATSATGVFAAGNLIHPVETADVVALDGRHVAASVHDYLRGRATATGAGGAGGGRNSVQPDSQASSTSPAPRLQQQRTVRKFIAVLSAVREVAPDQTGDGRHPRQRALLPATLAEFRFHAAAHRGPFVGRDQAIEAAVGNDLDGAVGVQHVHEHAVVEFGVPHAEAREDLQRPLARRLAADDRPRVEVGLDDEAQFAAVRGLRRPDRGLHGIEHRRREAATHGIAGLEEVPEQALQSVHLTNSRTSRRR